MSKVTRRDFLKITGIVVGGSVVACSGLGVLATQTPKIDMPEENYGDSSMEGKKVLLVYASKSGTTAEIAQKMGQSLAALGLAVEVKRASEVTSLDGYQSVVLGSAIRMGQWLPEALTFAKDNEAQLSGLPVAIFTVHMQNLGEAEEEKANRALYTTPIKEFVKPVSEAYFAGRMLQSRLSMFEKLICKMMKAKDEDLRDWNAIQSWTEGLPSVLSL